MKTNKQQERIPLHVSIWIRYLFQEKGVHWKELLKRFPKYSSRNIYRHGSKPFDCIQYDKRKFNRDRPLKLSIRNKRAIKWEVPRLRETIGSFTDKGVTVSTGIRSQSLWWNGALNIYYYYYHYYAKYTYIPL